MFLKYFIARNFISLNEHKSARKSGNVSPTHKNQLVSLDNLFNTF